MSRRRGKQKHAGSRNAERAGRARSSETDPAKSSPPVSGGGGPRPGSRTAAWIIGGLLLVAVALVTVVMALGYCGYFQAAEVDERVARSAEPARQLRETHGATLDDADRAAVRGLALLKDGKPTDAASLLKRAVAGHPGNVEFRLGLCAALGALGQTKESLGEWREILRIRPDDAMALNAVAWILATSPDAALRNGEEAVLRAKFAVEFGPSMNPQFLDTLAAAYAEAGQFAKAVKTAEQAQAAARRVGDGPLGGRIAARLDLYRAGKPFREAAGK